MTHRAIDITGRAAVEADPGPAPMLQWLAIADLVIDEAYQRPLGRKNWDSIQMIAANFRWSRFGPILVAPVEGGRFAVIDGQHRAHAAAICGFERVPAMVVQVDGAEQGRAFSWVNTQTIKVSVYQVFKADLAGGVDWAVRADRAVSAAGCKLLQGHPSAENKKPGQVPCVGLIRGFIAAGMDTSVTAGLDALTRTPSMHRVLSYGNAFLRDWIPAVHASGVSDPVTLSMALAMCNPFKLVEDAARSQLAGSARDKARKALGFMIREACGRRAA
jgi:hypothetical protein